MTKVILFGEGKSGKTKLNHCLNDKPFENSYFKTDGVDLTLIKNTQLAIWDLPGQPKYQNIAKACYRSSNIAVYCLDLSNPVTEAKIIDDIEEFVQIVPDAFLILVGTKNDECTTEGLARFEVIKQRYKAKSFITSAKDNAGIADLRQFLQATGLEFEKPVFINDIISIFNLPPDDVNCIYIKQQFERLVNNVQADKNAQQTFIDECIDHFKAHSFSTSNIIIKALITAIIAAIVIGSIGFGIAFAFGALTVTTALIIAGTSVTAGAIGGGLKAYSLFKEFENMCTHIEKIAPRAKEFYSNSVA